MCKIFVLWLIDVEIQLISTKECLHSPLHSSHYGKILKGFFLFYIWFSCNYRQIYRLPNIFLQDINGTWLDSPLELNNELYEILISNQMQRIKTRIYRLSKSFSYFYSHPLTANDRYYLQKLILILYNRQSNSIIDNFE